MHHERIQGSQSHKDKAQFHFSALWTGFTIDRRKNMFSVNGNEQGTELTSINWDRELHK